MGKPNIFKGIGNAINDTGNWISGAGKSITHGAKDAGGWLVGAAEDTFNWGEKTIGGVGNRILDFSGDQISKVTDIFNNPTFLIVAGAVIVAIIILK